MTWRNTACNKGQPSTTVVSVWYFDLYVFVEVYHEGNHSVGRRLGIPV